MKQALALALLASLAISLAVVPAIGGRSDPTVFARFLVIARAADALWDATPDDWEAPADDAALAELVATVVAQLAEEGLPHAGHVPESVGYADFGADRSSLAGRYVRWVDEVTVNERFRTDWADQNYLDILIHELTHAQGYGNEAQTQLVTWEVIAALGNLGLPGAWTGFLDGLRRDTLAMAWWMAAYGVEPPMTTRGATGVRSCGRDGCPEATADGPLMAQVDAAKRAVFTAAEYRRAAKRLRFWTTNGRDFAGVTETYVVRPLMVILGAICDDDPTAIEWLDWSGGVGTEPVPPMRLDDMDAAFRELGLC